MPFSSPLGSGGGPGPPCPTAWADVGLSAGAGTEMLPLWCLTILGSLLPPSQGLLNLGGILGSGPAQPTAGELRGFPTVSPRCPLGASVSPYPSCPHPLALAKLAPPGQRCPWQGLTQVEEAPQRDLGCFLKVLAKRERPASLLSLSG